MTKKRRRWVLFAVALFSAVVGLLAYLALRENPDYVRAAKGVRQARIRAEEAFGPLTWEEYRKVHGIVYSDDRDAWQEIAQSIPRDVALLAHAAAPPETRFAEVYSANKAWFLGLRVQLDPLTLHQPDLQNYHRLPLIEAKNLINALGVGIEGAADSDDSVAMTDLTMAAWGILDKYTAEPDYTGPSMILSGKIVISEALLCSAVRHRDDSAHLELIRTLLDSAPALPSIVEAAAGNVRSYFEFFTAMRQVGFGEINSWLDTASTDWGAALVSPSPLEEKIDELLSRLRGDKEPNTRRAGENTVDALEARMWESLLEQSAAEVEALEHEPGSDRRLLQFAERIEGEQDLSYELVKSYLNTDFAYRWKHNEFLADAVRVAIALISRYPDHRALSDSLPPALVFDDPFGGEPVLYKRTENGFVIYSRSEDLIDGGYLPKNDVRQIGVTIGRSQGDADFGIVVRYAPNAPAP
ncbi:MAG: hypothetical protein IH945_03790 [Armatimonadetes bacterium]|nr:hypothetical protein [Armatimonadota bacterium]